MTHTQGKRIKLLAPEEIQELYDLPILSQAEREEYFSLDENLQSLVNGLYKAETKIYMIIMIGYFRAKPVIPQFQLKEVIDDVDYVCSVFDLDQPDYDWVIPKGTRSNMAVKALSTLGFYQLKSPISEKLSERLADVATISTEPKYIFDECLAFLSQNRISLPAYSTIQDMVTAALTAERERISTILSEKMSVGTQDKLDHILNEKGLLSNL